MFRNNFAGKNVIVTGGTRGIGKAVVQMFASYGANVAFTYRNSRGTCERIENEYGSVDSKVKGYHLDLSDADSIKEASQLILKDFENIDVLVNNAGMIHDGYLTVLKKEYISDVIQSNLTGTILFTQNIISGMMRRCTGSVINISSISGVLGNAGQCNYAAAKMGLIGFTKSLALEAAARNVRVNAISPGFIKTDMMDSLTEGILNDYIKKIPLKRLGSADELANVVMFLASDLASFITGQNIIVDGGY